MLMGSDFCGASTHAQFQRLMVQQGGCHGVVQDVYTWELEVDGRECVVNPTPTKLSTKLLWFLICLSYFKNLVIQEAKWFSKLS